MLEKDHASWSHLLCRSLLLDMKRKKCIHVEKGTLRYSLSFSIPHVSLAVVISILPGHTSKRNERAFPAKGL